MKNGINDFRFVCFVFHNTTHVDSTLSMSVKQWAHHSQTAAVLVIYFVCKQKKDHCLLEQRSAETKYA